MSLLMSILDRLEKVISEESTAKDIERISYIKKLLNLQENEKIKNVPEGKIRQVLEMHGSPMRTALERYAAISEDANEKERIERILSGLKPLTEGGSSVLSVPEKHLLNIAKQTIKMHKIGAAMMGGPTHKDAVNILRANKYSEDRIKRMLKDQRHSDADIKEFMEKE